MEQIGNKSQITKYVPMFFDETKTSTKAMPFKDSNGKAIHFQTFKQAEKYLKGFTSKRKAIAKSVEHITIYM